MKKQTKLLVIGAASLVFVVGIVIFVIALRQPEPQPLPEGTAAAGDQTQETPQANEETSEEEHAADEGTDFHGPVYSPETQASMLLNARQAAQAYVLQPSNEDASTRKNRLMPYFAPSSSIPSDEPPIASEGYFTPNVIVLDTDWTPSDSADKVLVIVYLRVNINSGFDSTDENQSWIAELTKQPDDSWLTNTIRSIDLPYIEAQS